MKILLVGEFSGVHNNLKVGLESLGHEVKILASGDSYRKFGYDFHIEPYSSKYIGKIKNIFHFYKNLFKYINYDVIQFISPFSIPYYYYYLGIPYILFRLNRKSVYYVCGTDPALLNSQNKFLYFPFDDKNSIEYPDYSAYEKFNYYNWFLNKINIIIPSMFEYYIGYQNHKKISDFIMLPGSGIYKDSQIKTNNSKINILFGKTRHDVKGAIYIQKAIEFISEKYKDLVDIKIIEKVSFLEFLNYLEEADIVIDQCKSYSYGMNAIFAMEKSKIVFSGIEPESFSYFKLKSSPIINIRPDVSNIINEIIQLIENKPRIEILKNDSLSYVKEYHNPQKIALKFENIYHKL